MPASGRGANLDTSRRIGAPKANPTPVATTTPPAPQRFAASLPQQPFHAALHQAQQKVERAQRALPKQPTPDIPRLPNPTHAQTQAALTVARAHQKASGVPAGQYWHEAANDPRARAYVETIAHYAKAQAEQTAHAGRPALATRDLATAGVVAPPPKQSGLLGLATSALATLAAGSSAPVLKPVFERGIQKGTALGDALAKDPVGATRATATSIPGLLNGLATGTARLGIEGTVEGKPGTALEQLVKGITTDYSRRYGGLGKPGGVEADAKRIDKEGFAPELLDASVALGGPASLAGKALTKGVEATGYGAEDFARLAARREGETQALQAAHPAEPIAPPVPRAARLRAAIHESATQPRPNLRVAGGNERPSVTPGAAVKPQERSSNLFQGLRQTAIDNARRARTQKGLGIAANIRDAIEREPHTAGFHPEPKVQPLAHDVKPGEVAPLIQRGGASARFPAGAFFGAGKEQRVGTLALKGAAVEQRRAEATVLQHEFDKALKSASPEQRAVLVHAKEGLIPLHDPQKAEAALREVQAQAYAGSHDAAGRSLISAADRRRGSDVSASLSRVIKHIDKNGAESVFTPQFADFVHNLPDERLTAHRDSSLSQDALVSRRYRPQVEHLQAWADRHPNDPLAAPTKTIVSHIRQLESEGGDLRAGRTGAEMAVAVRHGAAADKYATAHNLSKELAQMHDLPTDPAYIEHTKRFTEGNAVHTVGNTAPRIVHQNRGSLAAKGYRSTDEHLILNGMLKNLRNDYKVKYLKPWDDRFNVAPKGLTAHEATEWLHQSGRDPSQFAVLHLGRLRKSIAEDLHTEDQAPHLNLDAQAHAVHGANQLDQALGKNIPRSDTTKGAGVYPIAAVNELKGIMGTSSLPSRLLGKAKAGVSSLMLGTSLPWLTTMSGVTYPVQSLYGGAGLASLREAHAWYGPLSEADKRAVDHWGGIDTPFEQTSHGITSERLGAAAPQRYQELVKTMSTFNRYPMVRFLRSNRPDHLILRMERVPRRYARINVAYKGIKHQALREMLRETKGATAAQSKIEMALTRLEHFGRKPAAEYVQKAMENQKFMEEHAQRLSNVLGEWKRMTQFERTVVSKYVLFYPWLRYSVKLAAKTLPANHPLSYALALQYGSIQHEYLKELLGTDPAAGSVYLGPEQPKVKPENRKFSEVGVRSANPLLNTVADLLGAESPSQLIGVLPPYMSDFIEYAVNRNLFTDKPLKGADKGETEYQPGHRPNALNFALNRALKVTNPGRTAIKVASGGKPVSDEYLPGSGKYVQYAPATLNKIRREQKQGGEGVKQQLLSELLPLIPHGDEGRLQGKLRAEQKDQATQKAKARKEHHVAARSTIADEAEQALKEREAYAGPAASSGGAEAEQALKEREEYARGR